MQTNHQKNRHLNELVAALNEAPEEPELSRTRSEETTVATPGEATTNDAKNDVKKAPLIPERSDYQPQSPPKPAVGSRWNVIMVIPLLAAMGGLLFFGYWLNDRLEHLESLSERQPLVTPPATTSVTLSETQVEPQWRKELTQLQAQSASLEKRLAGLEEARASDQKQILDRLDKLQSVATTSASPSTQEAQPPKVEAKTASTEPKTISTESWFVNLGTFYSQEATRPLLERARNSGLAPEVSVVDLHGRPGYRIQLTGIDSRDKAEKLAQSLESKLRLNGLWVGRE